MFAPTRPPFRAAATSAPLTSARLPTALLSMTLLSMALLSAALPAAAQSGRDPADVTRGRPDPAAVGAQPAPRASGGSSAEETASFMRSIGAVYVPDTPAAPPAPPLPADAAQTLQSLLYAARDLGDSRFDVAGRQRAGIDTVRRDMERVATQLWPHLSPQTQERYREALEQIKRLDRLENTDYRDVDAFRARGGAAGMLREAEAAVRGLEDAIAPMLQDVRSKLQQQQSSTRPVR